jgi:hypothetical protein
VWRIGKTKGNFFVLRLPTQRSAEQISANGRNARVHILTLVPLLPPPPTVHVTITLQLLTCLSCEATNIGSISSIHFTSRVRILNLPIHAAHCLVILLHTSSVSPSFPHSGPVSPPRKLNPLLVR